MLSGAGHDFYKKKMLKFKFLIAIGPNNSK